jgi:hypothetical protein
MQHIPQPGEHYRHYKSTWWDDHTYEVIGIAKHSEMENLLVIYTPLFLWTEQTRMEDATLAARPLEMRQESVIYGGKKMERFTKIA